MKITNFIIFLLLWSNFVGAQTIHINEPQFDGSIIYANDTIGDGIPLEKLESFTKTTSVLKTIAAGKATAISYVKNCCSTVRTSQQSNLNFLAPFIDRADPKEYIKVFKLTKEKKIRTVKTVQAKMKVFGAGDAEEVDVDYVKFNYKKYGERSYLITIDKLEPGEYAITIRSARSGTFYTIGID